MHAPHRCARGVAGIIVIVLAIAVGVIIISTVLAVYVEMNPRSVHPSTTPTVVYTPYNATGPSLTSLFNIEPRQLTTQLRLTQVPSSLVRNIPGRELVAFQLPPGYPYNYSVVMVGGGWVAVYLVGSSGDKLFYETEHPFKTAVLSRVYSNKSGAEGLGLVVIKLYRASVPGPQGSTITIYPSEDSYEALWYVGGALVVNTTAAGWFYVDYGNEVVGAVPDGGSWNGARWADCTSDAPGVVNGVGTAAAYTVTHGGYALDDCPVTDVIANWPFVGVDAWGHILLPTSFPGSKSIALACGCYG
ncbi:hypothetical protein GCM10007981_01310 [Thermocladium modestius]|uniref:Uncharacterized protein n=2 Tax=Thermocladium modestius TaxID=62609 RepID=A0A830GRL4_9CREN|nr:hypothetical protein GCM10007981_01310 [Thermocladium modestius]